MPNGLYLTANDNPTQIVRCPVHGSIRFSRNERRIIDHEVQRLRRIRQLALTALVYPGAVHTRFEHSVGVMDLAGRAFEGVVRDHEDRLRQEFEALPEFQKDSIARARQIIRLSGLLHDVGHPAFSHAAEKTIPGEDHEKVSLYVIRNVLGPTLDDLFFPGITEGMAKILEKSEAYTFLRQFVSGEMDMDRTDYLLRDSLHCGVAYGIFDYKRLIESLTVVTNPDTQRLQLAIERGGEHTFEALILARYQMNTQVCLHKLRRIYDYYLTQYMTSWGKERYKTFDNVLEYDDDLLMHEIRKDAREDNERTRWAKRIVSRNHHRVVYETGDNADINDLKKAKRLLAQLQKDFADVEFHLDDSKLPIHKLSVPGDQEEEKVEDLYILEKDGRQKLLAHESAIISKVPKRVRTVRIFTDATPEQREGIRERIKEMENTI